MLLQIFLDIEYLGGHATDWKRKYFDYQTVSIECGSLMLHVTKIWAPWYNFAKINAKQPKQSESWYKTKLKEQKLTDIYYHFWATGLKTENC